jgi:NitT/TauT family transport system permease protein
MVSLLTWPRVWLSRTYSIVVVLALWELVARSGWVNPRLFPSLAAIVEQVWVLGTSQMLAVHATATLLRVFAGFGAAAILGVALGFLMARYEVFGRLVEPMFSFGYPVPRVALYPICIFLFGIGHLSKVVLVALECLYPIAIKTYYGTRAANRLYLWSAQSMGASRAQVFLKVLLPAAAPSVFTGFRIALPIAMVIVIVTEMISSTRGLGWLITYASASLSRAQVFAAVAAVAAIGYALDRALAAVRNRLIFWERESLSLIDVSR